MELLWTTILTPRSNISSLQGNFLFSPEALSPFSSLLENKKANAPSMNGLESMDSLRERAINRAPPSSTTFYFSQAAGDFVFLIKSEFMATLS